MADVQATVPSQESQSNDAGAGAPQTQNRGVSLPAGQFAAAKSTAQNMLPDTQAQAPAQAQPNVQAQPAQAQVPDHQMEDLYRAMANDPAYQGMGYAQRQAAISKDIAPLEAHPKLMQTILRGLGYVASPGDLPSQYDLDVEDMKSKQGFGEGLLAGH